MDALIRRFSCLSLLALALYGCQSPPSPKQTSADFDALGRMEFDAAMLGQPNPNTIVRDGDHVSYYVIATEGRRILHLANFTADCHLPDAQMAHLTNKGMLQFAAVRNSRAAEDKQMPAEQKKLFLQSPQFKQVCAQTPVAQWRVISAPELQEWQLIDRASLNQKDGQIFFWSARVPAGETLRPRGNDLYAQERRRWGADCAQQQLTSLSTFYVDKQNRVIAGAISVDAIAEKNLNADHRQLLATACATPQVLAALKPFSGREQTPFVLPDPVLPASVTKSIEALKLPVPEHNIQRLRVIFKDPNEADRRKQLQEAGMSYLLSNNPERLALGRLGRDSRYLGYEPGKQLTERYNGKNYQSVNITFRGLIDLADIDYRNDSDGITVRKNAITDLRFTGDWTNMPVGALLSYTEQRSSTRHQKAAELEDTRFDCAVEAQEPASAFFPSLTGTAKVITCTGRHYRYGESTAMYAYLQAYGMFVPIDLTQNRSYGEFKIEAVE
ncbi:hypothetical protein SAMN04488483_0767 [Pseudomonas helmanticensis]|uniref:Uncharacterized protein n=1 Tax=Pseudomonas helmanticensis TaxID=1471381 RepID=A0ACD2U0X5_9PSED|nr:hypothetical protein [Pseudomonas helmanticensis]SMQ23111.1 hypothetical protein SAMN04488483_0767 [Pseudomonas helmanticensis]